MTDVTYFAGWVDAPDVEAPTGDNLEMAQRASRLADLREERAVAERRAELEDRAEQLLDKAPTLAEVLERVERQAKAEDWRTAKADAKALEELLANGGVEKDPADLSDLRRESDRKAAEARIGEGGGARAGQPGAPQGARGRRSLLRQSQTGVHGRA